MGMFDYIRCEKPLPDGYTGELQTKEFDCEMVTHVISSAGRMMLDRGEWETVPAAERRHPDPNDLLHWVGSMRRVPRYVDANMHGMVTFGGLETIGFEPDERYGPQGRPVYRDHDYVAKFTDGELVSIETDLT